MTACQLGMGMGGWGGGHFARGMRRVRGHSTRDMEEGLNFHSHGIKCFFLCFFFL